MTDQQYMLILLAIYSSHFIGRVVNMACAVVFMVAYVINVWKG